jgi:hypothetical protein
MYAKATFHSEDFFYVRTIYIRTKSVSCFSLDSHETCAVGVLGAPFGCRHFQALAALRCPCKAVGLNSQLLVCRVDGEVDRGQPGRGGQHAHVQEGAQLLRGAGHRGGAGAGGGRPGSGSQVSERRIRRLCTVRKSPSPPHNSLSFQISHHRVACAHHAQVLSPLEYCPFNKKARQETSLASASQKGAVSLGGKERPPMECMSPSMRSISSPASI